MNSGIKRLTSLCLALIMVFGLTFMPVYADDSNEMGMSIVFTDTSYEPISFAREGQTIYVGVKIDNYQPLCAYSWRFDYDPNLIEFDSDYNYSEKIGPATIAYFTNGVYKLSDLSPSTTNINNGVAIANFAKETNVETLADGIAFYLAFTVKSTGQITADFNREKYGNFTWRTASVDSSSKYTDINTTETDGKLNVVSTGVYLSQNEVTVNGTDSVKVTAYAFDKDVKDITDSVTWSVASTGSGVSIEDNIITVAPDATEGPCTISATAGEAAFGGDTRVAAATFTVTREHIPTSITVSGGSNSIEVPGDGADPATTTFTAVVKDQFGETMADADVKWSVSPEVVGVSIDGGKLTVTNEAKERITDTTGKTLTVTATYGEMSDTAKITVKLAESARSSIEILKNGDAIDSDNVAAGEKGNYTAQYYDQYGYPMDPPAETTPNWSIYGFEECVDGDFTLYASGDHGTNVEVSVNDAVKNGASATLKVSENNLSDTITITVAAFETKGTVTVAQNPTYGMTWNQIIDTTGLKVYLGNTEINGTFTITDDGADDNIPDAGDDVGYQVLFTSEDGTYTNIVAARGTVDIARKPVTVTGITAEDKVYDGGNSAELSYEDVNFVGKVDGDSLTIDSATGTFSDENAENNKAVTVSVTLDNSNYVVNDMTLYANITPKTLTDINVTGTLTKVYDATVTPGEFSGTVTFTGKVGEDEVSITATPGNYDNPNAGTGKSVNMTLSLSGEDKDNYTLSSDTFEFTSAAITACSTFTDATATDQNVVVGVGTFTEPKFTGIDGEEVTGTTTYTYNSETKTKTDIETALKGLDAGATAIINYSFTANGNYTGTITGTITVTMVDIVFTVDGATATADNAVTIKDNPTYGDDWSDIVTIKEDDIVASLDDDTLSGGTYSLNVSSMPNAGTQSYTVQYAYEGKTYDVCTGTVNVAQKVLTITGLSVENKEYDDNTDAAVTGTATLNGVVGTDNVAVTYSSTATFANKSAGTHNVTVSGINLTGTEKDNYTIADTLTLTATIRPKPVIITGVTAEDKDYDGTKTATPNIDSAVISGIISGDTVNIKAGTGTFASADVGNDITVTFSGFSLTGTDSGNYTLSAQPASTIANITKANYTGTPNTVTVNVLINQDAAQTGSVSIDQFFQTIPAGAVIKEVNSTDDLVIADMDISDDGKVITYTSKANLTTENEKDTYTVTIETKNYNDITATLTFTTVAKTPVNISGVSVTGAGKTYDGKAVSYTGTPAAKTNDGTTVAVTGTYSYVWQKADGTVLASAPKDAGIYKLVITLDDPAYIGSAEVSFTIAKAKITITAEDAEAYTGSDMPKLSYTVSGLATGEKLAKEPSVSCAADMKKAGSYVIAVSGAEVPNTNNYEESITYVSGTLEVKNRPVNIGPTYDIKVLDSAHGTVRASLGNASEGSVITLTVTPDDGYKLGSITVIDENGDEVEVRRSGSEYKFTMPDSDVRVSARFVRHTGALPFNDVNAGDWFYEYVAYVYNNGIMDGVGTGEFSPNTATTRGMVVTVLYRLYGEPAVRGGSDFTDVAPGAYYADAVAWASNAGIVNGTSATTFSPNDLVTREQFAAMLYRHMQYTGADTSARASLSGFADAGRVSSYAADALAWAVAEGVLNGRSATEITPQGNCTRAEVAAMITRVFG